MNAKPPSYHGYRFPPEIISHAVWLYYRFCLSFRDVEVCRAVDQDGDTIDILVQKRRNKRAGKRFYRKLLKDQCASPRRTVTDKLRGTIGNLFRLGRHLMRASRYREFRSRAFSEWQLVTRA